jgi:hypothetical protein
MAIFCPKCRKKHALKDCPLENIQVCAFCTEHHDMFNCPKVKVLQNCNMAANTEMENVYYMGAKRPWQPRPAPQGMFPNQNLQFPMNDQMYAQNSWNVPMPWQHQNQPTTTMETISTVLSTISYISSIIPTIFTAISTIPSAIFITFSTISAVSSASCLSTPTYSTSTACSSTNKSTTTAISI